MYTIYVHIGCCLSCVCSIIFLLRIIGFTVPVLHKGVSNIFFLSLGKICSAMNDFDPESITTRYVTKKIKLHICKTQYCS